MRYYASCRGMDRLDCLPVLSIVLEEEAPMTASRKIAVLTAVLTLGCSGTSLEIGVPASRSFR